MFSVRADNYRRRPLPVFAGAAVVLVLLTGCQGDADPPVEQPTAQPSSAAAASSPSAAPSASSSPEPSPASSAGPAANLPVPVKPALADENSAEGLEAFTEYWFELFSYGYETNDWAPFEAVTDPGCKTCNKVRDVVEGIYADGRWISGGAFEVISFTSDFRANTSGSIQAFVDNRQAEIVYFESDGSTFPPEAPSEPMVDVVFASYVQGAWVMRDFGRPEGS